MGAAKKVANIAPPCGKISETVLFFRLVGSAHALTEPVLCNRLAFKGQTALKFFCQSPTEVGIVGQQT